MLCVLVGGRGFVWFGLKVRVSLSYQAQIRSSIYPSNPSCMQCAQPLPQKQKHMCRVHRGPGLQVGAVAAGNPKKKQQPSHTTLSPFPSHPPPTNATTITIITSPTQVFHSLAPEGRPGLTAWRPADGASGYEAVYHTLASNGRWVRMFVGMCASPRWVVWENEKGNGGISIGAGAPCPCA